MILSLILTYGLAILLCFHAVRSGQATFWLWILLAFPGIGPLAYIAIVLAPELMGGSTARRLGAQAKRTLDPTKDYREARFAAEDSPTVGNRMRLAQAAFDLQRYEEAEQLFAEAAPLLAAGEDEKYQTEVMRLAPAEKLDPRKRPPGGE